MQYFTQEFQTDSTADDCAVTLPILVYSISNLSTVRFSQQNKEKQMEKPETHIKHCKVRQTLYSCKWLKAFLFRQWDH